MTLVQLCYHCTAPQEVAVRNALSVLEVREEEANSFCCYALRGYFTSKKFQEDQDDLLIDYDDACYHGLRSFLTISRDSDGFFYLTLETEEYSEGNEQ